MSPPSDRAVSRGHDAHQGRFVVVPASYVFLLRDAPGHDVAEVLLQLRSGTGFMDGHWAAAAAGHVERGETAPEAARREAREEIGVDIDVADLAFVTAMQRTRGGEPIDERVDFFFSTRTWRGEPSLQEPDRSAGLRWCALDRLDELPDPVVPHERSVLVSLLEATTTPYTAFGFEPRRTGDTR